MTDGREGFKEQSKGEMRAKTRAAAMRMVKTDRVLYRNKRGRAWQSSTGSMEEKAETEMRWIPQEVMTFKSREPNKQFSDSTGPMSIVCTR